MTSGATGVVSLLASRPALDPEAILAKAATENFPVALFVLPARLRERLSTIYLYARTVDDLGDLFEGDRDAALDWAESEITSAFGGAPAHPVLSRVAAMALELHAPLQLFVDLIEANRLDQRKVRYTSFGELEDYCALSANPVGRLVLFAFGRSDVLAARYSDRICTALQIVEHLQDVAEDYRSGRVYLPGEDLASFGVDEDSLGATEASSALRRLVAFESARARRLLEEGEPLVRLLPGRQRLAIAGFIGGGLAQIDAIAAADYDVLAGLAKARKSDVAARSLGVLRTGARRPR